jgi:hypothetical protein
MTWAEIGLTFLVPAVGGLAGWLWRLHQNDLRHIHERLDRVERKLDEHLLWHLNHER